MSLVTVSIGSNVNPMTHIHLCLDALDETFASLQLSRVFESEPVGCTGSRNFYNLVAAFHSDWSAGELQQWAKQLEIAHGRTPDMEKCTPRALDIDLLTVGNACGAVDGITLPRAEIIQHAFVLQPLAELLPDEYHPGCHTSYASLWQHFILGKQRLWPIDFDWRGRKVSQAEPKT